MMTYESSDTQLFILLLLDSSHSCSYYCCWTPQNAEGSGSGRSWSTAAGYLFLSLPPPTPTLRHPPTLLLALSLSTYESLMGTHYGCITLTSYI